MVANSLPRAGKGCPKDREGALILLLYEKRNLEIHSSDAGGNPYRYSDYPRRDLLYITPFPDPFPVKGQGGGRRGEAS